MGPEARVKHAVKKRLKRRPEIWYYMPVSNGLGRVGAPDFLICAPVVITPEMVGQTIGVFVGVEAKADGKRLETTANQDREIAGIHKAGGIAVVIDDAANLPKVLT